jgi:hypothetical protein
MPTNAGYVEAEARVFSAYALSPSVRALSLAQPRVRLRAVEVGGGEPVCFCMASVTVSPTGRRS